jgi:predicted small integral membrane protein
LAGFEEAPMEDVPWMAWMAWTPATAAFFVALGLLLAGMIWLARTRPEVERVGVLGIPTTRGDRLFLSLVLAAVIHLTWIGFFGAPPIAVLPLGEGIEVSSLWLASAISLVAAVVVFRTV